MLVEKKVLVSQLDHFNVRRACYNLNTHSQWSCCIPPWLKKKCQCRLDLPRCDLYSLLFKSSFCLPKPTSPLHGGISNKGAMEKTLLSNFQFGRTVHSITLPDKRLTGRSFPYEVSGVCLGACANPGDSPWKLFSKGGNQRSSFYSCCWAIKFLMQVCLPYRWISGFLNEMHFDPSPGEPLPFAEGERGKYWELLLSGLG